MARKKQHTNETSARIVAVGNAWGRWGTWAGLPAWGTGDPKLINAYFESQFILDENDNLWHRDQRIIYQPLSVLPNTYPIILRIHKSSFNWDPGYGNTKPGDTTALFDFTVDATSGTFSYDSGQRHNALRKEDVGPGKIERVDNGMDFWRWRNLSELDIRSDGIHIWLGARGHYDREDEAINPSPAEIVLSGTEIPWDYYPMAINESNNFVSCNNQGHGLFIKENLSYRDVKNIENLTTADHKGLIYNNKQYQKILKG